MTRRTEEQKAARIRAEMIVLRRLSTSRIARITTTCPLCHAPLEAFVLSRGTRGEVERSRGRCSTPACLEWTS